ncbi:MAG: DUF2207 family protein [Alphaproteobacteria bacterium]
MVEFSLEHPASFTAFAGFLLMLAFYGLGWWLAGRDPAAPDRCGEQTTPPENLSPAALRFARRMAADTHAAAAALMALAARGQLVMDWEGERIRLRKTDHPAPGPLPAAEAALARGLLYTRSTLVLHNSACKVVFPALKRFRRILSAEHGRTVFRANRGWLAAGLALSALVLAASAAQSGAPGAFLVLSGLGMAAVTGLAALAQAVVPRRYIFPEPLARGLRAAVRRAVEAGLIVVASPLAFVTLADMVANPPVPLAAVAFVAALAGLHVLVYHSMKAPTVPGAALRGRIEAFRTALAGGSKGAEDMPVPAGVYAFALDLPADAAGWASPPAWFRISKPGATPPGGYGELGEALARALSAAAMPPAGTVFRDAPDRARPAPPEAA